MVKLKLQLLKRTHQLMAEAGSLASRIVCLSLRLPFRGQSKWAMAMTCQPRLSRSFGLTKVQPAHIKPLIAFPATCRESCGLALHPLVAFFVHVQGQQQHVSQHSSCPTCRCVNAGMGAPAGRLLLTQKWKGPSASIATWQSSKAMSMEKSPSSVKASFVCETPKESKAAEMSECSFDMLAFVLSRAEACHACASEALSLCRLATSGCVCMIYCSGHDSGSCKVLKLMLSTDRVHGQ